MSSRAEVIRHLVRGYLDISVHLPKAIEIPDIALKIITLVTSK